MLIYGFPGIRTVNNWASIADVIAIVDISNSSISENTALILEVATIDFPKNQRTAKLLTAALNIVTAGNHFLATCTNWDAIFVNEFFTCLLYFGCSSLIVINNRDNIVLAKVLVNGQTVAGGVKTHECGMEFGIDIEELSSRRHASQGIVLRGLFQSDEDWQIDIHRGTMIGNTVIGKA